MIGLPARPASTEKSDASIPAHAMITSQRSISSRRERRRSTPATPTSGTIVEETPRYSSDFRASSAIGASEVPAVTMATVPSTRGIDLPTARRSVAERGSYSARPGSGEAESSSQASGVRRVTSTSCALASWRQISATCAVVFPCASTTSGKPTRRRRSRSSV